MKRVGLIVSMVFALALTPCLAFAEETSVVPEKCTCGASWTEPAFAWEDMVDPDNWTCVATLTCADECGETLSYSSDDLVNDDDTLNENCPLGFGFDFSSPTCSEQGYTSFYYTIEVCVDGVLAEYSSEVKTVYEDPVQSWWVSVDWEDYFSADNWNYTITLNCYDCDETVPFTGDSEFVKSVVWEPTCTEYGCIEGLVCFEFEGELCEDAKYVDIEPLGHDFDADGVCSVCGEQDEAAGTTGGESAKEEAPVIAQTGDQAQIFMVAGIMVAMASLALVARRKMVA